MEHVSHVLYHWRAAKTSTASDINTKDYIFRAGVKALDDHFRRKNIPAKAKAIVGKPGHYKPVYKKVAEVSIIIGDVEDRYRPACVNWLKQLTKHHTENIELVVGKWFGPYASTLNFQNVEMVEDGAEFIARAVKQAKHSSIIIFNEAALPRHHEDIYELAAVATYSGASLVQPVITSNLGMIYNAGFVDSYYGLDPLFRGIKFGEDTFFGNTDWPRNLSAVSTSVIAGTKSQLQKYLKGKNKAVVQADDCLLWTHTQMEWNSRLNVADLKYSNSQLGQTMFDVNVHNTTWSHLEERSE